MNEEQRPAEEKLTAGQSFVKSIRPLGCALFLILAVLVTAICLTAGRDPIPGYTPPERASYENDLTQLVWVLEEQVFPALPQYAMTAEVTGDTVTVTVDGNLAAARSAILHYFPEDLITFERGKTP